MKHNTGYGYNDYANDEQPFSYNYFQADLNDDDDDDVECN
jgi:hypothetical protein